MSVHITDNTVRIKIDTTRGASLALRYMVDDIDRIANPRTPKKLGNLRKDLLKQVIGLHGRIEWRKRYAAIQEKKQFKNYTTPGTGPHFAENAVRKVAKDHLKYFRKARVI